MLTDNAVREFSLETFGHECHAQMPKPHDGPMCRPRTPRRSTVTTENKESDREDLDHKPENAGKVGEEHKRENQQGEKERTPSDEGQSKPVG